MNSMLPAASVHKADPTVVEVVVDKLSFIWGQRDDLGASVSKVYLPSVPHSARLSTNPQGGVNGWVSRVVYQPTIALTPAKG